MSARMTPLRRCRTWCLPGLGTVALIGALTLVARLPREADRQRLAREIETLEQLSADLVAQGSANTGDELTDRLPRTLSVGAMLQRIEQAARAANVRAVSFGSDDAAVALDTADDIPSEVTHPTGPTADTVRCEITVDGSFQATVLFIGLLETMPAITRVASLSMTAHSDGVTATIGVLGYAYTAAASPAAPEGR